MSSNIYSSTFAPTTTPDDLSVPQFMVKYNPDGISHDKTIHIDTLTSKTVTYGGLRSHAGLYAAGLRKRGLQVQDRILCVIPNSTDFLILAHSVWWTGGIFAAINPASSVPELTHSINLVRPKFICVYPDFLDPISAALAASELDRKPEIITIINKLKDSSLLHFPEDFAADATLPPFDPADHGLTSKTAIAHVGFSSGTTGPTKAVAMSHYALIAHTVSIRASLPHIANSGTREAFFPMYCHVYGLVVVLLNCAWFGNFTCGMHKFDLEEFCRLSEKYRANYTHMVPSVAAALLHSGLLDKYNLSSIKDVSVAAAPLKPDLQRRVAEKLGGQCRFEQAYGMTECMVVTHARSQEGRDTIGTIGTPMSGLDIRIVHPQTLKDVETGEEGELWARSPWVMSKYLGNEAATKDAFSEDGQWLRTGDIVKRDEKGDLWVSDRLKEMIKYKGFQVSPSELEGVLQSHGDVVEAAVRSYYNDEEATEVPQAFVVLRKGLSSVGGDEKTRVLEQIRQWTDAQVADHKRLRGGVFSIEQLPKNGAGKILRRGLPSDRGIALRN